MTTTRGKSNVFEDLGFSPEEALNLHLRAELMASIERWFSSAGLTQQQAAKQLGITQPRLNLLLRGRIDDFSLDALVNIAAHAGLSVKMTVRKATLKRAA